MVEVHSTGSGLGDDVVGGVHAQQIAIYLAIRCKLAFLSVILLVVSCSSLWQCCLGGLQNKTSEQPQWDTFIDAATVTLFLEIIQKWPCWNTIRRSRNNHSHLDIHYISTYGYHARYGAVLHSTLLLQTIALEFQRGGEVSVHWLRLFYFLAYFLIFHEFVDVRMLARTAYWVGEGFLEVMWRGVIFYLILYIRFHKSSMISRRGQSTAMVFYQFFWRVLSDSFLIHTSFP